MTTTTTQGEQENQSAEAIAAAANAKAELTPEQQEKQAQEEDDAFAAGFDGAHGEPLAVAKEPDKASATEGQAAANTASEADASAQAGAEDEQPLQLSGPELKALLAQVGELKEFREKTEKQFQQIYGKFGDVQRQVTAAAERSGQVLTPRQINAESLKRMKAEYPDIAEQLAGDLGELLAGTSASAPGITQEQVKAQIDAEVSARVNTAVEAVNEQLLSRFHPDYEDIAKSDDLKVWLKLQAEGYRSKFLESKEATFVAAGLDKFKAWQQQSQGTRQTNKRRLESAIPARGGSPAGSAGLSDDAAFEQGFMNTRRGG